MKENTQNLTTFSLFKTNVVFLWQICQLSGDNLGDNWNVTYDTLYGKLTCPRQYRPMVDKQ